MHPTHCPVHANGLPDDNRPRIVCDSRPPSIPRFPRSARAVTSAPRTVKHVSRTGDSPRPERPADTQERRLPHAPDIAALGAVDDTGGDTEVAVSVGKKEGAVDFVRQLVVVCRRRRAERAGNACGGGGGVDDPNAPHGTGVPIYAVQLKDWECGAIRGPISVERVAKTVSGQQMQISRRFGTAVGVGCLAGQGEAQIGERATPGRIQQWGTFQAVQAPTGAIHTTPDVPMTRHRPRHGPRRAPTAMASACSDTPPESARRRTPPLQPRCRRSPA
eukprot:ctg_1045.g424